MTIKSMVVQFHSTTEEFISFIWNQSNELKLYITYLSLNQFRIITLNDIEQLSSIVNFEHKIGEYVRLYLTVTKPKLSVNTENEFLDANNGCIVMDIGKLTEFGLEESSIMFRSDNELAAKKAVKIISRFKKIIKTGIIAINRENGVEVLSRGHRYTEGAEKLFNSGVKLLPVAGGSLLRIPD